MQQPSLPAFDFGTRESFDSVRHCVPRCLLALAAKGPALLGLEPQTVVVAGLAHLAAAIGRCIVLDDGGARLSAAFSLAVISDASLPSNWMHSIGRGWLEHARRLSMLSPDVARAAIHRHFHETVSRKRGGKTQDPQMDQFMDQIPENLVQMLRMQFISNRIDPTAVSRSLVKCRDHAVTLINGADDPFEDWLHLTYGKQRQLIEMLRLSWNGSPLPLAGNGAEALSNIACLWQTATEPLRKAWFSRGTMIEQSPPPVLLFRQHSAPRRFPDVCAKEFVEWSRWLEAAFELRLNMSTAEILPLVDEARELAEKWFSEFAAALTIIPTQMHRWLTWLPDLALRLYQLLIIAGTLDKIPSAQSGKSEEKASCSPPPNQASTIMYQAIRLTRWLAHQHSVIIQEFVEGCQGTEHSTPNDTTDIATLQEGILQRLRDKGPLNRRDLQRTFHVLSAKTRDRAVLQLKSLGMIQEGPAGELQLSA